MDLVCSVGSYEGVQMPHNQRLLEDYLKNGTTIAVKNLFIGQPNRAQADLESEVKIISNVHHRNLLRLLGCCKKKKKKKIPNYFFSMNTWPIAALINSYLVS